MTQAQYRFIRCILQNSESFTANSVPKKGVFAVMSRTGAATYIPIGTVDGANRPIWGIFVPHDDTTFVTDPIVWDGLNLTILRVVRRRWRGSVLYRLLIAH